MNTHRLTILSFLLLATIAPALAIDVTIPDISVPAEKSFTLAIATTDVTGSKIFSLDFRIIYDPAILTATSVSSAGTLMADWGNPTVNIGAGEVRVSSGGTTALTGSGTLCKIVFRVPDNAPVGAKCSIAFAAFMFNEGNPPAAVHNGTFTVILDTSPPVFISGPTAGSITSRSAVISWTTDEPSTSVLDFGETTSYGQKLTDNTLVTNHAMTITGLKASQTLHYRAASTDKLGNGPALSADKTFRTNDLVVSLPDVALDPGASLTVPITTTDLTGQNIQSVQMTITFDANLLTVNGVSTDGTIITTWPAPAYSLSAGRIEISLNGPSALAGSGVLAKLQFTIAADVAIGRKTALTFAQFAFNAGDPPATTRDGSFTVKDTQAPVITAGPEVTNITSSGATIIWTTNEKATSKVEYGKTTDYGFVETSATREGEHRMSLSGLDAETLYHFRVSSKDSSGNGPAVSTDLSFTTVKGGDIIVRIPDATAGIGSSFTIPVEVTDLTGKGVFSFSAVVQYDRTLLEFVSANQTATISAAWNNLAFDTIDGQVLLTSSGTVPLSGSGALANLSFKVKNGIFNADTEVRLARFILNSGQPEVSTKAGTVTITGNPDQAPPRIVYGPIVDQLSTNSARVFWYTDEPATSKIEYGTTGSYGSVLDNPALATYHSLTMNNLTAGTGYHLRALSADARGNGPTASSDLSFSALSTNGVAVTVPEVTFPAGSSFELPIHVGNLSGLAVYSAYLVIVYDEQTLIAKSVSTAGTLTADWGDPVFTITPGRVVIAMGGIKALTNSGKLVKLTFDVNAQAVEGVQTPIVLDRFTFNEGNPVAVLSNGWLSIKDISVPVIQKGPVAFALTPNSASILWATNEPTTATIDFGTSTSYSESKSRSSLSSGHLLVLSGLEERTLYHYQISSADASGNGPALSGDQSFITPAERILSLSAPNLSAGPGTSIQIPIDASDVSGMGITSIGFDVIVDPALLTFNRLEAQGTLVEGWSGLNAQVSGGKVALSLSGPTALWGAGTLIKLVFDIPPTAAIGAKSPLQITNLSVNNVPVSAELTNGQVLIKDLVPPQITDGPYVSSITATSAEIFWFTDEPASSTVQYGLSTALGQAASSAAYLKEHRVLLNDLVPNSVYYFRAACSDSFGNGPSLSEISSFHTPAIQEVSISLPDTSGDAGQELLLPIRMSDLTGQGIKAVALSLLADAQIVQFLGATHTGGLAGGWNPPNVQVSDSSLKISFSGETPLAGAGSLLFVQLRIKGTAVPGSTTPLIFSEAKLNDGNPPLTTRNGIIRVADHRAPTITSGPFATEIGANSATIVWYTDEISNSSVEYGTTTNYGKVIAEPNLVKEHRVTLPGLRASTIYHFRVSSTDSSGNGPTTGEDNTFTTSPEVGIHVALADSAGDAGQTILLPISVSDVSGQAIRKFSFELLYDPAVLAIQDAVIANSLTANWNPPQFAATENRFSFSANGETDLTGSGVLLFLKIRILETAPLGSTSLLAFTQFVFNEGSPAAITSSGSIRVQDHQPPLIISGPFVDSITPIAANLYWKTSEPSKGLIEYGLSTGYGDSLKDDRLISEHRITFTDLLPATLYHYRIGSTDSLGNGPSWSADASFTTATIPGIYVALPDTVAGAGTSIDLPIRVQDVTAAQLLSIDLTVFYDPQIVRFSGATSVGTLTAGWGEPTVTLAEKSLRVQISGATALAGAGILLRLIGQVQPNGGVGNKSSLIFIQCTANNGAVSVVTKNGSVRIIDITPPSFVRLPSVAETFYNGARLQWESNEKTTGRIEYGETTSYGTNVQEPQLSRVHDFLLTGLKSGTLYHARVGLVDSSGNGPVFSEDLAFNTASGDIAVSLPDTSAGVGSLFWLPIRVPNLTGLDVKRAEFKLAYNSQILTGLGATTEGTIAAKWGQPTFSDSRGQIQIVMSGSEALNGAGTLVFIGFQVAYNAAVGASTQLVLSEFKFNGNALLPVSTSGGLVTIEEGSLENAVTVTLPVQTAYADAAIAIPVRVTDLTNHAVMSYEFTIAFNDSILQPIDVATTSCLTASWPAPTVYINPNSIQVSGQGYQALADSGALVQLNFRTRPRQLSGRKSDLQFTSFRFNQGSPRTVLHHGAITIAKREDAVSGFVFDKDTSAPLDSVLITLQPVGASNTFTALSDAYGYFIVTGLRKSAAYALTATKNDYAISSLQAMAAGTENVLLYLEPKNGSIQGKILNKLNKPVAKALIIADDAHGNFGSANSDSTGQFRISKLAKAYSYKIRVAKYGYQEQTLENVPVNSNLTITLSYDYGKISGTVKLADSTAVVGARVLLRDLTNQGHWDSTKTNESGLYSLPEVIASDYILTVDKQGYLSEPEQYQITLGPGQALIADFSLEPAVLHRMVLQGEQEAPNNAPTTYYYSALTETGRKMGIAEPEWKVLPGMAGSIRKGVLQPNASFLGEANIIVTEKTSKLSDTLLVEIYAPVTSTTNKVFQNPSGAKVTVTAGCFDANQKLKLIEQTLPPLKVNAKNATAYGKGFLLKPDELQLSAPIQLILPLPTKASANLTLGNWDKENAEWRFVTQATPSDSGRSLTASISSLGLYALLAPAQPLGIRQLKFLPNPFSPEVDTDKDGEPGLSIHLTVSSLQARLPLVTIRIYNMVGDLVRELAVKEPITKDNEKILHWDGLTDDRRLARNGRYIVRTEVEDGNGRVENVGTVVLVK